MDTGEYKDYVLFMLFIESITDKYGNRDNFAPPKFKDGERLRTYDYVVANPPFSDKTRALKQAMMQELLTGKTRLVSREDAKNAKGRQTGNRGSISRLRAFA
jgi:type I restriction-modification system DNA methylase subunit